MLKKVEGIIISEVPYGDSSKIINVFTNEGIIGLMCKGAMGLKSKNRGTTLKLTYGTFNIYFKDAKLSTLASSDVINPFKNIHSDISLISYATYLCDLVSQVLKQNNAKENIPKIYDDFLQALFKIEDNLNPLIISNILEVKLLDYLGVGLNLVSCCSCGSKKNIVTLSSEKGGLICEDCYEGERIVPIKIVKIMNMYYLVDIKSISKLNIAKDIYLEINNFLSNYYDDYTGLYLKSKNFLKTIQELN